MTKFIMVEAISQHRVRYVVELNDDEPNDYAEDQFIYREDDPEFHEFSQQHLGNIIVSHREISKDDYLLMFDEDNDYLASWSEDQKFKFINKSLEIK